MAEVRGDGFKKVWVTCRVLGGVTSGVTRLQFKWVGGNIRRKGLLRCDGLRCRPDYWAPPEGLYQKAQVQS